MSAWSNPIGGARLLRSLCVVLLLGLAAAARAEAPGRVGRLAEVDGTVWVVDPEQGGWTAAVRNRPITGGDRLATDAGARAVVQIGSATLRLAARSEVEWLQLDDDQVRIRVHDGSAALRLRSADVAREFEFVTAQGRWQPLAAGHYRVDVRASSTVVHVLAGEGWFDAHDSRKTVRAGERLEFWQRGAVTHYDAVVATADDFDRWLRDADRSEAAIAATRHVSAETTGWDDLDRYGRWDRHPEFGVIWLPLHVAPGWAPYRHGRWVWLRPWGWTWVDDAPWGFAPFHYGRWVWWSGRWAWVPGPYTPRPVFAPALVGWLGASGSGWSVSIGFGPLVAWVPLGPYDVYRPWYTLPPRHVTIVNPHPPRPPSRRPDPHRYGLIGVPGAVTVVPGHVLTTRRPVGDYAVRRIDPDTLRRLERDRDRAQPPAPPPRTAPPGRVAPPGRPPFERFAPGDVRPEPRATPAGQVAAPERPSLERFAPGDTRPDPRADGAPWRPPPGARGDDASRRGPRAVPPTATAAPTERVAPPAREREAPPERGATPPGRDGARSDDRRPGVGPSNERRADGRSPDERGGFAPAAPVTRTVDGTAAGPSRRSDERREWPPTRRADAPAPAVVAPAPGVTDAAGRRPGSAVGAPTPPGQIEPRGRGPASAADPAERSERGDDRRGRYRQDVR